MVVEKAVAFCGGFFEGESGEPAGLGMRCAGEIEKRTARSVLECGFLNLCSWVCGASGRDKGKKGRKQKGVRI